MAQNTAPATAGQTNGPEISAGYTHAVPLDRRRLLLAFGALTGAAVEGRAAAAEAGPVSDLEEQELDVPGERLAHRCLLLVPRGGARRVVVLFHGLGETTSEALGIRAWADRYGLVAAAARLRRPPVVRTLTDVTFLTDARLGELNAALAREPFRGLALACPYTPNFFKQPSTSAALDRYAAWTVDALLPAVRRSLGLTRDEGAVAVDGVSLGGFVSLEVFLRRPEAFQAAGATQPAIGENLVSTYAERLDAALERVGPRPLRLATSSWDGGRKASVALAKKLAARGVAATLSEAPGPHDQRWLREVGSLELLMHYDRVLSPDAAKAGRPT
jgi:pimeloyl-ACP methyl ester carboxylesterase